MGGSGSPASHSPKPNPGRASLARRKAYLNSSPRSVIDVVRRSELPRLGAITRESPGLDDGLIGDHTIINSAERSDGCQDKDPVLDLERD
jgi:hypothetical protein